MVEVEQEGSRQASVPAPAARASKPRLSIQASHPAQLVYLIKSGYYTELGKTSIEKNVFFRALPESHNPPWPQFGQLGPLFGRQKRRFGRMTDIFFDDDNDGFNDNYDDNFGNFDDNYDKND